MKQWLHKMENRQEHIQPVAVQIEEEGRAIGKVNQQK